MYYSHSRSLKFRENKYRSDLESKFGKDNLKGSYFNFFTKTEHKCLNCGKIYTETPNTVLNKRSKAFCSKCVKNNSQPVKEIEKVKSDILDRFGTSIKISDRSYKGTSRKAKFKCVCGNIWESKVANLFSLKYGCPECAKIIGIEKRLKTHEQFIKEFKKIRNPIKIIGTYEKNIKPIKVQCEKCKFIWNPIPKSLLKGYGCPQCYKRKQHSFLLKPKKIIIDGKCFEVLGFEDQAIHYLCRSKKIDVKNIEVFSSGKVPIIDYTFNKIKRKCCPDILVKNKIIIEVKSNYTLFKDFEKNKAKAKACVNKGYKFKLLVINSGYEYLLPKYWYKKSKEEIQGFLNSKNYKNFIILSFDPGVNNMAWSVINFKNSHNFQIIATGMLENTLKTMKGWSKEKQQKQFIAELIELKNKYNVNAVCAERFMTRGNKGITIELVNIMLGSIQCLFTEDYSMLITAAQWKNELNKKIPLEKIYNKFELPDHAIDSMFIGLYCCYSFFGKKPYLNINQKKVKKPLIRNIKKIESQWGWKFVNKEKKWIKVKK